jgi:hypothetical protein
MISGPCSLVLLTLQSFEGYTAKRRQLVGPAAAEPVHPRSETRH